MKNILTKITLAIAVLGGVMAITLGTSGLALAQNPNYDSVCNGINATGGDCTSGGDEINNLVAAVINVFSWVVGVVAVIMVIYGGFEFVTSGGDSAKSAKGRNTIFYALIGLVIVALAQVIVKFVLNRATKT